MLTLEANLTHSKPNLTSSAHDGQAAWQQDANSAILKPHVQANRFKEFRCYCGKSDN